MFAVSNGEYAGSAVLPPLRKALTEAVNDFRQE